MKITLYGGTGQAGSRILDELLRRGHQVSAVVRDAGKLEARNGLSVVEGNVNDAAGVAQASREADALVSAYGPGPEHPENLLPATRSLIQGAKRSDVPRFVYVGGAGNLEVAPGVTLIDSGHLPAEWMGIAVAHRDAMALVRDSGLNWTCLSPAAMFAPGERTGQFRLGKNSLIADAKGNSRISMEDFAIALVDELEKPRHERSRFTIGY